MPWRTPQRSNLSAWVSGGGQRLHPANQVSDRGSRGRGDRVYLGQFCSADPRRGITAGDFPYAQALGARIRRPATPSMTNLPMLVLMSVAIEASEAYVPGRAGCWNLGQVGAHMEGLARQRPIIFTSSCFWPGCASR